jgi:hypothetical protein
MAKRPANTEDVDTDAQAAIDAAAGGETTAVAVPQRAPLAFGEVDADPEDIIRPTLKLAYGVGKLAETFLPGDLVLNEEHCIAHKTEKLTAIVISCDKQWKEHVPVWNPDSDQRPQIFATREEAHEAGFATEWTDDPHAPRARPTSRIELLIEKPDGLECPLFCMPLAGKEYAPVQWYVDKSSWTRTAKEVLSAKQMALAIRGVPAGRWTLYSQIERVNGNPVPMPYLKLTGFNDEALMAELRKWFGEAAVPA